MTEPNAHATQRQYLRIAEIRKRTGLGESTIYRALRDGSLRATKIRNATLIHRKSYDEWVDGKPWLPLTGTNHR